MIKSMKILLVAATLFATSAHADDVIATVGNKSGGEIVFTTRNTYACKGPLREAYSTTPDGHLLTGCWVLVDNYLKVIWSDGDTRAYPWNAVQFSDWFVRSVQNSSNNRM